MQQQQRESAFKLQLRGQWLDPRVCITIRENYERLAHLPLLYVPASFCRLKHNTRPETVAARQLASPGT